MRPIKIFPYHTLLLPVFFILHIVNAYFGLIQYTLSLLFLGYYLLLAVGLLFLGRLIMGSFAKAGCWATGLLVIFFFFGAAHDTLRIAPIPRVMISYKFMLSTICILVLLFTWLLLRVKSLNSNLNSYLTLLFSVLVMVELVQLGFNKTSRQENDLARFNQPVLKTFNPSNKSRPDIFFIVFDEYASSAGLKKYLAYNNQPMDSFLLRNHFYIVNRSKSNYNSTPLSIGSTFNLNYFNVPLTGEVTRAKLRLQSFAVIRQTELPDFLSRQGYRVYNFGLINLKDNPVYTSEFVTEFKMDVLSEETIWGRVKKDIGWHFNSIASGESAHKAFIDRNEKNLSLTLEQLNARNDTPKFVFCHVMMPHQPFLLDSLGSRVPYSTDEKKNHSERDLYIGQLAYANTWIRKLALAANHPFERPRVVIIEGDHGYRDNLVNKNIQYDKQFMNLNAWFFSDSDYKTLSDSVSPVNSFRLVLNKYFDAQLTLLKDSTILLR